MNETKLTERGRRTRQRIIEATGEQILASGIGGTTLDTVRAATLTSKSQLFHYFPGGKTELVREVAVWEGRQLFAAQEPEIHDLGSWGSWERWRAGLVEYYIGRGRWACPIGSLATQAAAVDAELDRTVAEGMRAWRSALAAGVLRMRTVGLVAESADPGRISVSILAAIQGGLVLSQPERSAWPLEAALDSALSPLRSAEVAATPAEENVAPAPPPETTPCQKRR
ncbi:TetR/AcrR family transcriptional regulator [Rhodococcus sp. BP-349]|uniref:TetR/AcrR family transcriptional regulator n=1 Tax=unclassified Rhodococcus (in: high G+C Gram-positive bacteria) TaxID=192944 RepID=UPI001C9B08D2|nr:MULTISPECIES: TetR/AcrR family transcriptional regulator [unclassified Rhodococcus (in: high G+C Gram-positive bacteria)]MBY6537887.1 TetR/AcrR family transcriptional regulator [Rhodococcus sp. BP-363]MBY6542224.1 TetR/AcrR family transcriptional regulator [Rhodococcus sp. BP-369]MBY6561454.1 TetR/AcrR family transcriptional regulator [Rhodococcus sp. BP-370]MBY6575746.1 TetR/AcrR family transcriptional regulator [Rhodococcus sp. BP-364]MBY6585047.1 TetR/AcrR family transcriptional regulato